MEATQAPQVGTIPTLGVDHVAFNVPDLAEALAFFTTTLGCSLLDAGGPVAYGNGLTVTYALVRADATLAFELLEWRGPDVDPTIPRFSDTGGGHIAFAVADLDAALAAVAADPGLEATLPAELPDGRRFMRFTTAWGLTIQLLTRLPTTDAPEPSLGDVGNPVGTIR
jgi:catechol 2,3-dioxygenase-like lactoylglutathione lyase family enzyme